MARHRKQPQVAAPTGKRLAVELAKDLVIAALTCSAVVLALQTPMARQVRGWVSHEEVAPQPQIQRIEEAVIPYGIAARNSLGLYGVSYDEALVNRAFESLSPYLGEALATAGGAETVSVRQWQALLEKPGVYCALQGSPPLEALSAWLGGGGSLTGEAQALLVAWDGSQVWLGWRDGERYYRSRTQVAYEGHLSGALEEFSPNGAAFAYSLAETDEAYQTLDPWVLVAMTTPQPQEYTASSPDFVGDEGALQQLLTALGFQSGVGSAYQSGKDLAILESGDRLRVGSDGSVVFHAGEEIRYAVACAGEEATAAEAAFAAWELVNRAAAPWKGETAYLLTGVKKTETGWSVEFQGRLKGIPLLTGTDGECARVEVEGRSIQSFSLTVRSYAAGEGSWLLPGERLAAAAMNSLPGKGRKLVLCYSDNGGQALSAGWIAEER